MDTKRCARDSKIDSCITPFLSTIPSRIRSFLGINAAPRMNLADTPTINEREREGTIKDEEDKDRFVRDEIRRRKRERNFAQFRNSDVSCSDNLFAGRTNVGLQWMLFITFYKNSYK